MSPLPGHIIVSLHRGSSPIGRLIRWQTRSVYSHASLIVPDIGHIEAREFKGVVRHDEFTAQPGETVDFFFIAVSPEQLDRVRRFLLSELGCEYDYAMVWHFVTRGGPLRASAKRWFCSELVFAAFLECRIELLRATQAWEVSPGLLGRAPALRPYTASLS